MESNAAAFVDEAVPTPVEPEGPGFGLAPESQQEEAAPAAILRGTQRGLELVVNARATVAAIARAFAKRLDEAPSFFRGNDVRVAIEDGPLPLGCLGKLEEIAERFELRITEVRNALPVPKQATLAAGSAPTGFEDEPTKTQIAPPPPAPIAANDAAPVEPMVLAEQELTSLLAIAPGESFEEPTQTAVPVRLAASPEVDLVTAASGPRLVIGPVRSGVILDHTGHVIIFGDVNPGAEVRATGNIIVLGRLRGTAHAGIGQDVGFILALRLEPQQLRIGRQVARAADSDTPPSEAEIAYKTAEQIVVERYTGKLPRNLATSI